MTVEEPRIAVAASTHAVAGPLRVMLVDDHALVRSAVRQAEA